MALSVGRTGLLTIAIASFFGSAANAAVFNAFLSGANERPTAVVTPASGFGKLFLADDGNSFSVDIDFTGLSGNAIAGHIHCCSSAEANAMVAVGFAVPAATSGNISGMFDLTLGSTYNPGFLNNMVNLGSVATARATFLNGLAGGNAYFNIHTALNPGGEIRGQLAAVPEPGSWALLIAGFGLTGAAMRRRRPALVPATAR